MENQFKLTSKVRVKSDAVDAARRIIASRVASYTISFENSSRLVLEFSKETVPKTR
jgi:hypothetical protein